MDAGTNGEHGHRVQGHVVAANKLELDNVTNLNLLVVVNLVLDQRQSHAPVISQRVQVNIYQHLYFEQKG